MSHHDIECQLLFFTFWFCLNFSLDFLALHRYIFISGRFLLRLLVTFCLLESLACNELDISPILFSKAHCVILKCKLHFSIRLKSDVHGVNKWLVQIIAPVFLVRVDKNEVALFCSEVGNSVHEDSVMVSWEADSKEARLEAGNGPYPIFNFIVRIGNTTKSLWAKITRAILAICNEHDCQFFQVRIILK